MTTRKRNDTWPPLTFTPFGPDQATLVAQLDVSSKATVIMRGISGTVSASAIEAGFVAYDSVAAQLLPVPKVVVEGDLEPATGVVEWIPETADVDSEGYWLVEVEYDLDGDGARVVTAPTEGYWPVRIIQDLGDAV